MRLSDQTHHTVAFCWRDRRVPNQPNSPYCCVLVAGPPGTKLTKLTILLRFAVRTAWYQTHHTAALCWQNCLVANRPHSPYCCVLVAELPGTKPTKLTILLRSAGRTAWYQTDQTHHTVAFCWQDRRVPKG